MSLVCAARGRRCPDERASAADLDRRTAMLSADFVVNVGFSHAVGMNISTRPLEAFLLVARLGSFTRAAEQVHMTQAGLSASIRELERQFACRLFDRTTRFVSLTVEGRVLLPYAERVRNELHAAARAVEASAASSSSVLTVAVTPIAVATLIAPACREFSAVMPGVELRIRDVQQSEVQRLVEAGDADIGLTIFPKPATNVDTLSLMTFRLVCLAPKGTLESRKGRTGATVRWGDLPRQTLITLPPATQMQQLIDKYLVEHAAIGGPRTSYNSMQTILAMVSGGQGMAILPSMVLPACDPAQLDIAYLSHPAARMPFFRIARKGAVLPASANAFIKALKAGVNAHHGALRLAPV